MDMDANHADIGEDDVEDEKCDGCERILAPADQIDIYGSTSCQACFEKMEAELAALDLAELANPTGANRAHLERLDEAIRQMQGRITASGSTIVRPIHLTSSNLGRVGQRWYVRATVDRPDGRRVRVWGEIWENSIKWKSERSKRGKKYSSFTLIGA